MGQVQIITFTASLESIECFKCGVTFAFPSNMMRTARDRGSELTFYCPNGHPQSFIVTEVEKLRRALERKEAELAQAKREVEFQRTLKDQAERATRTQKAANTRLQRRIGVGVCPCCKRSFRQVADHIRTKHPEYLAEARRHDSEAS